MSADNPTPRCDVFRSAFHGYGPCEWPTAMRFGYDVTNCNGAVYCQQQVILDYCQKHGERRLTRIQVHGSLTCGCVLLEVVDLVKADPGVEYAEMLRGLA